MKIESGKLFWFGAFGFQAITQNGKRIATHTVGLTPPKTTDYNF